jgi:hypothetical protein
MTTQQDALRAALEHIAGAAMDIRVERSTIAAAAREALAASQDAQPVAQLPDFVRRSVERAIEESRHGMQLNDGKERVTLPGGTLRLMLRLLDAA